MKTLAEIGSHPQPPGFCTAGTTTGPKQLVPDAQQNVDSGIGPVPFVTGRANRFSDLLKVRTSHFLSPKMPVIPPFPPNPTSLSHEHVDSVGFARLVVGPPPEVSLQKNNFPYSCVLCALRLFVVKSPAPSRQNVDSFDGHCPFHSKKPVMSHNVGYRKKFSDPSLPPARQKERGQNVDSIIAPSSMRPTSSDQLSSLYLQKNDFPAASSFLCVLCLSSIASPVRSLGGGGAKEDVFVINPLFSHENVDSSFAPWTSQLFGQAPLRFEDGDGGIISFSFPQEEVLAEKEVTRSNCSLVVDFPLVVNVNAATFEVLASLAFGGTKSGLGEKLHEWQARSFEARARNFFGWNFPDDILEGRFGNAFETATKKDFTGTNGFGSSGRAMDQVGDFFGQRFVSDASFGFIRVLAFEISNLFLSQEGKIFEHADDIAIVGANPKLVKAINTGAARVQPDRSGHGFAELAAIGIRDQRQSKPEDMRAQFLAAEVHARSDIAPLIAAADLEFAIVVLAQAIKIERLQQHVAEFGVTDAGFAIFHPGAHALLGHHHVDGKMLSDIPEKIQECDLARPIGIIEQLGRIGGRFEIQQLAHLLFNRSNVCFEQFPCDELALGGFATGIADQSCGATRKSDGPMPPQLEAPQGKQRNEIADVEAVGGGIEPRVKRDGAGFKAFRKLLRVGAIGQQSSPLKFGKNVHLLLVLCEDAGFNLKKDYLPLEEIRLGSECRCMIKLIALILASSTLLETSAGWVAFNDYAPGLLTHTNATIYGPGGGGPLKDIATGSNLPVSVAILGEGVAKNHIQGVPAYGSPASIVFDGFVFFDGEPDPALELAATTNGVTYTFSGLDTNKLYNLQMTAVRGNLLYKNRWTICGMHGMDSFTRKHTAGTLTHDQVADLTENQVVINTGNNAAGDLAWWEDIKPGPDGSFSVRCAKYSGKVPGGSSGGPLGYGLTGFRLEEGATYSGRTNLPPRVPNSVASTISGINNVFVIVMENHKWQDIKGSSYCKYINETLLPMSSYATQYYSPLGNHPSEPNYIWLMAGTNFNIQSDDLPSNNRIFSTNAFFRLLDDAGISWKTYQENISGTNIPATDSGQYVARHNPFIFFDWVRTNVDYVTNHVRPYAELTADLTNDTVPRFSFLVPNLTNDMHNLAPGSPSTRLQGDHWLEKEVPKILSSRAYQDGGALFVTWDEGANETDGPIGMIVLSPRAKGHGYSNAKFYTHSSALRTFQDIFGVQPYLADAAYAEGLDDLFLSGTPTIASALLNVNAFELTAVDLPAGSTIDLQASDSLEPGSWSTVLSKTASDGTVAFSDSVNAAMSHRFYRIQVR
jgi:hypothetical protein